MKNTLTVFVIAVFMAALVGCAGQVPTLKRGTVMPAIEQTAAIESAPADANAQQAAILYDFEEEAAKPSAEVIDLADIKLETQNTAPQQAQTADFNPDAFEQRLSAVERTSNQNTRAINQLRLDLGMVKKYQCRIADNIGKYGDADNFIITGFGEGSAALTPEMRNKAAATLDIILQKETGSFELAIKGNTNEKGSAAGNARLAQLRAHAGKQFTDQYLKGKQKNIQTSVIQGGIKTDALADHQAKSLEIRIKRK